MKLFRLNFPYTHKANVSMFQKEPLSWGRAGFVLIIFRERIISSYLWRAGLALFYSSIPEDRIHDYSMNSCINNFNIVFVNSAGYMRINLAVWI